MIKQIFQTSLICFAIGIISQSIFFILETNFLDDWLKSNLPQLQIALLAINSASLSVTLSKIREISDKLKYGKLAFKRTRTQMLLSIQEQVFLILVTIFLLTLQESPYIKTEKINIEFIINGILIGSLLYSLNILYDTAKSVLLIIDFSGDNEADD